MDIRAYNRKAWNKQVQMGNQWTIPVTSEQVAAARRGEWSVLLTPSRPVPRAWFGEVRGAEILGLASGGGQQGPILAAAGANVTVLDNSPRQLEHDRQVAARDGLSITTIEGDMRHLTMLADNHFDLIFHPVSNTFVDDILAVWREAFRVLRPGGFLLAGFTKPVSYIFDFDKMDQGILEVVRSLPYDDLTGMEADKLQQHMENGWPLEWSHTLETQIGGQLLAGFHLVGFYEDIDPGAALEKIMPSFIATRAWKPGG